MGIRLVQGRYIQVRISRKGHPVYHCNFGLDTPLARELAMIHLAEKKKEILMGKFGIKPELPSRPFNEVAEAFFKYWKTEIGPDGNTLHTRRAIQTMGYFIGFLKTYFTDRPFDSIRPLDVVKWRKHRLQSLRGTSVNREQNVLSSIFSTIEKLINLEELKPFKLPSDPLTDRTWNPCQDVERAPTVKRERIPTDYELKKIKLACRSLPDLDGWEIIKLALKSILSEKDLRKLELGSTIDLNRAKTNVPIHIPITVLQKLNWTNWRKRWEAIRTEAGCADVQFRDLRKKGGNYLIGKHDTKLVSQYFGHASVKTTEASYVLVEQEKMRPLAQDLEDWVEGL